MYEFADRVLRKLNRRNLRLFDKLRLMPFDELNILRSVSEVYDESYERVRRDYLTIALEAYIDAAVAASTVLNERKERGDRKEDSRDVFRSTAKARAKREIDEDWILDMLEEYDSVTMYRFIPEKERKKMRLAEALVAAKGRDQAAFTIKPQTGSAKGKTEKVENPATSAPREVDKAFRLWTGQIAQYAISVTDRATLQGFRDNGVKYVMWHTQEDEKVCPYCLALDRKVFRIEKAPKKQHYRCRCYYTPVSKPEMLFKID